jgi:response regulator of citrate/malate metabolism
VIDTYPMLAGLRVLLIEDDVMVSMMIEETLSELQCILVATAGTVDGALSAIREHEAGIDGVLLDLHLGSRSVTPLVHELLRCSLPFVVTSGSAVGADTPPAVASAPWLVKPFTLDTLARRMTQAFGGLTRMSK